MAFRGRLLATVALIAAVVVGFLIPQSAQAYPPGRKLIVSLLPNVIQPTTGLAHLRVKNTKPGPVYVEIGDANQVTLNGVPGYANYDITNLPSGKYRVVVTSGAETATKYVYVPKPVIIPQIQVVSRKLDILFKYAPQGTVLSFELAGKPVSTVAPTTFPAAEQVNYTIPPATLKLGVNKVGFPIGPNVNLTGSVNGIIAPY